MKVKELIALLEDMDIPEQRILLMGDPEGNSFWHIDSLDQCGFNGTIVYPLDEIFGVEGEEVCLVVWPKREEEG